MRPLTEKQIDYLYWSLVDYCEEQLAGSREDQAKINLIFKKIVKLNNKVKEASHEKV